MNNKICCFAGHANIYSQDKIKEKLKKEIINLIENYGVTEFYNGGKGDFDWLCAQCVDKLRKDYPFIKSYLILAYMPKEKDKNEYDDSALALFDSTLYPSIEKTPRRFAIVKRNQWMINNADFLIAYIDHSWGGAYKTFEYAKRKKHILVINIG